MMLKRLRVWRRRRSLLKQAIQVVDQGGGAVAARWALTTSGETVARECRDWLVRALSSSSTPYGINFYTIMLALTSGGNTPDTGRVLHWQSEPIFFQRMDSSQALDDVERIMATLPHDQHAGAAWVEVVLVSIGDVARAAVERHP